MLTIMTNLTKFVAREINIVASVFLVDLSNLLYTEAAFFTQTQITLTGWYYTMSLAQI